MPVMNGISQLEGEHGIGLHFPASGANLVRREPVLVESVVPADSLEHFEIAAH